MHTKLVRFTFIPCSKWTILFKIGNFRKTVYYIETLKIANFHQKWLFWYFTLYKVYKSDGIKISTLESAKRGDLSLEGTHFWHFPNIQIIHDLLLFIYKIKFLILIIYSVWRAKKTKILRYGDVGGHQN